MSTDSRCVKPLLLSALSVLAILLPSLVCAEPGDQVGELIEKLKSGQVFAQQAAAIELGRLKDARAVPPLSVALRNKDWGVRRVAAEALAKIGSPAVPALIAALKDDDWVVRQEAARGLGMVGEPAVQPLIAALKDEDWRLRSGAATALGKIKDTRAIVPLIVALKDTDQLVHQAAVTALGEIGEPSVAPLVAELKDKDWRVVCCAVEALGKVGAPAVNPLLAVIQDATQPNRWAVAWALEIIGSPPAKEAVDKFLEGQDLAEVARNYSYIIKRGQTHDEYLLAIALERFGHPTGYGYPQMAQDFLNSGNPFLMETGRRWAVRYKYEILSGFEPPRTPRWGKP